MKNWFWKAFSVMALLLVFWVVVVFGLTYRYEKISSYEMFDRWTGKTITVRQYIPRLRTDFGNYNRPND